MLEHCNGFLGFSPHALKPEEWGGLSRCSLYRGVVCCGAKASGLSVRVHRVRKLVIILGSELEPPF